MGNGGGLFNSESGDKPRKDGLMKAVVTQGVGGMEQLKMVRGSGACLAIR